jgi:transcriptional regulator with XRE-family HTH domain
MNARLQQFLVAENISQAQFAETIGVARASISHILSGRNKPGFDFLESMVRHYPNLNFEWLLTGRGKMYNNAKAPMEEPAAPVAPLSASPESSLFDETDYPDPTPAESPAPRPATFNAYTDNKPQRRPNQRVISKVILFYSDGSFQELV